MRPNQIVIWGAVLWLIAVLGGIIHGFVHQPPPSNWLDDLERFIIFLIWQGGAFGISIFIALIRLLMGKEITGPARWLGWAPIILSGGFAILVVIWISVQG